MARASAHAPRASREPAPLALKNLGHSAVLHQRDRSVYALASRRYAPLHLFFAGHVGPRLAPIRASAQAKKFAETLQDPSSLDYENQFNSVATTF